MRKSKTIKTDLIKDVKETIKRYDMVENGDKVLVAVSGGPDSVCLLDVMASLKGKYGLKVMVANMDHGIRGKESKQDSDFVKKISREYGLKWFHKKIRLSPRRKGRSSLEEIARKERYAFLLKSADAGGCDIIATGHNLDDQAETVLMRVIKGTSLKGLSGIPPVRRDKGVKIIRPLIRCSKADILNYLEAAGLGYCCDHTNEDKKYFRNSVRKDIIPYLKKYNPKLPRNLVNLSDTVREDMDFIAAEKNIGGKNKGVGRIDISDVLLQPKTVRKEVFKKLFLSIGGDVKKLTYRHWIEIDKFIKTAERGKSLDLPGKVRVRKIRDEIVFTR